MQIGANLFGPKSQNVAYTIRRRDAANSLFSQILLSAPNTPVPEMPVHAAEQLRTATRANESLRQTSRLSRALSSSDRHLITVNFTFDVRRRPRPATPPPESAGRSART
jgi:hypothetical protein